MFTFGFCDFRKNEISSAEMIRGAFYFMTIAGLNEIKLGFYKTLKSNGSDKRSVLTKNFDPYGALRGIYDDGVFVDLSLMRVAHIERLKYRFVGCILTEGMKRQ